MGTSDGSVIGATKILDHGPDSERWTVVIVAEGYQASQMSQFQGDAQGFVNTLLATAPFNTLQAAINVYRLDVTSTDAGADDPAPCGGTGAVKATYFDASFCNSGIQRLLECDSTSVINTVTAHIATWNMIMVMVNTTEYGGSGGAVATFSLAPSANEIGLHEMGHTAFHLADEYATWAGCGSGEAGHDHAPTTEPSQPNITVNTNRATIKWGSLIQSTTPLPTTTNANCSDCDPQANPFSADTVGAYEGAGYYHCGCYRPQYNCRMQALGFPYCAVCRKVIVDTLTPYMPHKIPFKEIKDHHKDFKIEKIEKVEVKHEIKELEKVQFDQTKFKDLVEGDPFRLPQGDPAERVQPVDAAAQRAHFITPASRPDLSRGALAAEPQKPAGGGGA